MTWHRISIAMCTGHLPHLQMQGGLSHTDMQHYLTCHCLAGIMGAKQTSQLIPLCHNISLTQVNVWLELHDQDPVVLIRGDAYTIGRTGKPPSLQTTFLLKHGIQADGDCYHWSRGLCLEVSDRGRFARWIEIV